MRKGIFTVKLKIFGSGCYALKLWPPMQRYKQVETAPKASAGQLPLSTFIAVRDREMI